MDSYQSMVFAQSVSHHVLSALERQNNALHAMGQEGLSTFIKTSAGLIARMALHQMQLT